MSLGSLEDTGEHGVALLLVAVAKLLAVGALLALGPVVHLDDAHGDESGDGPVAAGDDDADPGQDLEHVVGAGDEAEAVADGDLALGAAGGAQGGQVAVDEGVARLAKQVDGGAHGVNDGLVGRGGERGGAVDEVGAQQTRDGPVEEAVLEDVEEGHGVGGELVDEEGLDLALEEVQLDHAEGEPLGRRQVVGRGAALVEVGAGGDDGGVDEHGAEVLDDEDGPPADLDACDGVSFLFVW